MLDFGAVGGTGLQSVLLLAVCVATQNAYDPGLEGESSVQLPPAVIAKVCLCACDCAGLSLLAKRKCSMLRCIEINAAGQASFRLSLKRLQDKLDRAAAQSGNQPQQLPPAHYTVGSAGTVAKALMPQADVMLCDPPRKGLDDELLRLLCGDEPGASSKQQQQVTGNKRGARRSSAVALPPGRFNKHAGHRMTGTEPTKNRGRHAFQGGLTTRQGTQTNVDTRCSTLIYLSCGFPALRNDCDALLSSGLWVLSHAEAFVFFPGSNAIETLAVFHRSP